MIKYLILSGLIVLFGSLSSCSESTGPEENFPGSITKTEVSDSIRLPQPGYLNATLVKAWVEDPNGLKDVDSVYFYSQKPDGSMANGGYPLYMVDNGEPFSLANPWISAGDEEKGDGVYSLTILIEANNQIGIYKFTFYMKDESGELSEAVVDSIEVYE